MIRYIIGMILGLSASAAHADLVRVDYQAQVFAVSDSFPHTPSTTALAGYVVYDDSSVGAGNNWVPGVIEFSLIWEDFGISSGIGEIGFGNSSLGNIEDEINFRLFDQVNDRRAFVIFEGQPLLFPQLGGDRLPSGDEWDLRYLTLAIGSISVSGGEPFGWEASFQVTDVQVSVIPVPMAGLLFGSALLALGLKSSIQARSRSPAA